HQHSRTIGGEADGAEVPLALEEDFAGRRVDDAVRSRIEHLPARHTLVAGEQVTPVRRELAFDVWRNDAPCRRGQEVQGERWGERLAGLRVPQAWRLEREPECGDPIPV